MPNLAENQRDVDICSACNFLPKNKVLMSKSRRFLSQTEFYSVKILLHNNSTTLYEKLIELQYRNAFAKFLKIMRRDFLKKNIDCGGRPVFSLKTFTDVTFAKHTSHQKSVYLHKAPNSHLWTEMTVFLLIQGQSFK